MCDSFGDANCLVGTTAPQNAPPSVPDNFAPESFYYAADSTINTINGGNKAVLNTSTEGAFGNIAGAVAAGDQITFGRLQFRVTGGLVPGAQYRFTHPYGVDVVTADAAGAIPVTTANARVQTGCGATPPACDFGLVFGTRVGPWLTQAPGQAAPPKGYIGDGVTNVTVTGSPYSTNFFQIDGPNVGGPGINTVKTDLFTLSGKSAGPIVAEPSHLDFLDQEVNTASAAQTVTLTNLSPDPVTVTGVTSNLPDFTQTGTTCTVALATDDSCTVDITFTPTVQGVRDGTLTVVDSATPEPLTIPVTGTGLVPTTAPNVNFNTSGLVFDAQRIGTTSAPQTVTLTNTGDADLRLSSVAVTGANANEFVKGSSNCPSLIAPGASCTTDVTFKPTGPALRSAALTYTDNSGNAVGATQSVPLSGNGTQAVASLDPASVAFSRTLVNGNATPQPVTVTNTGSASLTISDVSLSGVNADQFGVTSGACVGASISLQPGQSCTVNVGFSPTTAGTKSASLVFTDNGSTTTQTIPVSGVAGDPLPPTVSAPVQNFTEAGMPLTVTVVQQLAESTIPIAIRWSQTNTEPLDHYELQQSNNGGSTWNPVTLPDPKATSVRVNLKLGTNAQPPTYMFRVRGYGLPADRIGAWTTGQRVPLTPIDNPLTTRVKYSGNWTQQALAGAYGGNVHFATAPGPNASLNKASFTVTGNVALMSTMGPDRGRLQISVDGQSFGPVTDLYSPTVGTARVPVAVDNLPAGTHTVTVTVLGTRSPASTGTRVDIDGWAVIG
jgi:hypothetical protein